MWRKNLGLSRYVLSPPLPPLHLRPHLGRPRKQAAQANIQNRYGFGAPGARDKLRLVIVLTKATSCAQEQLCQNARPRQMLETVLILELEGKGVVHGSLLELCQSLVCQESQAYLLLSLPSRHRGSCPNARVQIVFMTVLRRSDRAF